MGQTNYSTGHEAEQHAAAFLEADGYKIKEINWRTPACEIDIIANKQKSIYFIEVKFRQTLQQGSGIEYITPKKLQQMKFAAEIWVQHTKWRGDYHLGAIELFGPDFQVTSFIDSIF